MSYIGVFDSGVGGLSVLKKLISYFPQEQFIYKADSINLPYGNKDGGQLLDILENNISFFHDARVIVVACNTLSTLIPRISKRNQPVISMVEAMVQSFYSNVSKTNHLGILATPFTIQNNIYFHTLNKLDPKMDIDQQDAPLLACAIEHENPNLLQILENYLDELPKTVDTILLGCTHYNLLLDNIKDLRPSTKIVDPYHGIIKLLKQYIKKSTKNTSTKFLTNQYSYHLQSVSEKIMESKVIWEETLE